MKKWMLLAALAGALVIAGCAQEEEPQEDTATEENGDTENNTDSEDENAEAQAKSALLDFQMDLTTTLKSEQPLINDYYALKDSEDATDEEVNEAQQQAKEASTKLAGEIRTIEVPEDFGEENKQTLEEAIGNLAQSYETRAEAIDSGSEELATEADEQFGTFEEEVGKVYDQYGMLAPSFKAEIE
ncbi:hypothetical protein [Bacillus marinisedimentorum]|uniref:hypothetical protein n=1 Tax=Bacillus marinisedimentorum TaxID=1821260 RepID=UPI0007E1C40E|nr:hypothetical protein [Bacillus marinisedimentorum]